MNPELANRIQIWRQKELDGTLTKEDLAEAIQVLRQDRISAAAKSSVARQKKAKAEIPSAVDLLNELDL